MSIPATAPAQIKELLQINGRLIAERDALLAAAGTLDKSRSKVAELQAVAQAAEYARDEAAQRLAAIKNPADLRVIRPTRFELVVNLSTAKGAGSGDPALDPCPGRRGHRVRLVIAAAVMAVWLCTAILAIAQDAARLPVVTVLQIKTAANVDQTVETMLRDELKALGHIDGKTFRLEFRLTEADPARLSEMAMALVRDEPSVIVASGEAAIRAVLAATHTIPIVANANDLVASGLIDSLAIPGGNITGVSMLITELDAKRREMLKEILPSARRFGTLNDPAATGAAGLQAIAGMARAQVSRF